MGSILYQAWVYPSYRASTTPSTRTRRARKLRGQECARWRVHPAANEGQPCNPPGAGPICGVMVQQPIFYWRPRHLAWLQRDQNIVFIYVHNIDLRNSSSSFAFFMVLQSSASDATIRHHDRDDPRS